MNCKKIYILPLLICIGITAEFIIFYLVAVFFGHVFPLVPYISDTGSSLPESCFFAEVLGGTSCLLTLLVYLRFIQVRDLVEAGLVTRRENVAALVFGWLCSFGLSIVASFQLRNLPEIHLFGSILTFGCGSLYQLLTWRISLSLKNVIPIPNWMHPVKLILGLISFCMFVLMYSFSGVSIQYYHGEDSAMWSEGDGGYDYHLVSTITEWICAITSNLFIGTMAADFKYFKLEEVKITKIENV